MADSSTVAEWIAAFPEVLALLTLALGVVLAFALRKGVTVLVDWVNRVASRAGTRARPAITPAFLQVLKFTVFWGVVLAALTRSLTFFAHRSSLLEDLWSLETRLLVALAIVAVGHVLGVVSRNLLGSLLRSKDLAALPQVAYVLIVGASVVMALAHLGLDVTLITQLALIFIATSLAALGLAFALGARTLVANLAAQSELARYRPGDRLRIDGTEGTVLEVDRTAIVLSTAEGLARIPAARFAESTVIMLNPVDDDG